MGPEALREEWTVSGLTSSGAATETAPPTPDPAMDTQLTAHARGRCLLSMQEHWSSGLSQAGAAWAGPAETLAKAKSSLQVGHWVPAGKAPV